MPALLGHMEPHYSMVRQFYLPGSGACFSSLLFLLLQTTFGSLSLMKLCSISSVHGGMHHGYHLSDVPPVYRFIPSAPSLRESTQGRLGRRARSGWGEWAGRRGAVGASGPAGEGRLGRVSGRAGGGWRRWLLEHERVVATTVAAEWGQVRLGVRDWPTCLRTSTLYNLQTNPVVILLLWVDFECEFLLVEYSVYNCRMSLMKSLLLETRSPILARFLTPYKMQSSITIDMHVCFSHMDNNFWSHIISNKHIPVTIAFVPLMHCIAN